MDRRVRAAAFPGLAAPGLAMPGPAMSGPAMPDLVLEDIDLAPTGQVEGGADRQEVETGLK
jgi:hypothetical protein